MILEKENYFHWHVIIETFNNLHYFINNNLLVTFLLLKILNKKNCILFTKS